LILEYFGKRLKGGYAPSSYEFRALPKSGDIVYIHLIANVIQKNGEIVGTRSYLTDVTLQKSAVQKLEDSEIKYRSVIEQINDCIFIAEIKSRKILEANDAFCNILGYTLEEIKNLTLYDFVDHPRANINDKIKEILNNDEYHIGERNYKRKDGKNIPMDVSVSIITYSGKKVFSVVSRDISERKIAEKEIKESAERLSLALEGANIAYWDQDFITGKVLRSESWAEMLGYKLSELSEEIVTWKNLIHPEDLEKVENIAFGHENGECPEFQVEHRLKTKKNQWKWILNWGKIVDRDPQGKPLRAVGIHQDITVRKLAEKSLIESEERFRNMYETMTHGVVYQDSQGNIISANPAAVKILGLTIDQMKGRTSTDPRWKAVHEDGSEFNGVYHPAMKALKYGRKVKDVIMGVFNPNNKSYTWININAIPQFNNGDKKPSQVFTIFEDITLRKIADEKVFEYAAELKELNANKDKLFSIIAHDLRNPFNTLLGYSDYLSSVAEELSRDEVKEFALNIYNSADSAFKLLENLLQWSRLQIGRIEFSPSILKLYPLVDEAVGLYKSQAKNKNISLNNTIGNDVTIFADENMVSTVLRNLISNALKFTPEDGSVDIKAENVGKKLSISICDNGIGISEKNIDKLFRIEEQFVMEGTHNERGTGLGLILCKELVEKNEGTILVKSRIGSGSEFIITLPIKDLVPQQQ